MLTCPLNRLMRLLELVEEPATSEKLTGAMILLWQLRVCRRNIVILDDAEASKSRQAGTRPDRRRLVAGVVSVAGV